MDMFILRCLFLIEFLKGYVEMKEECNICHIGSTLQPTTCPDCCCSKDGPNTKNCCYNVHINHKNDSDDTSFMHTIPFYILIALLSLVLVTVLMTCCFKLSDQKCFHCWRRKSRRTRRTSEDEYAPPAYDNFAMRDVEIRVNVTEAPPYTEDPPSYNEAIATCNPTDLPEINNDNG